MKVVFAVGRLVAIAVVALLPAIARGQPDRPMSFSPGANSTNEFAKRIVIDHGVRRIYAVGIIAEDTADRLKAYATREGLSHAKVIFNSPGGSLIGGLRLGMAIRALKFDTEIGTEDWTDTNHAGSICASACAYAFAGGINRYYGLDSRLGIHQFAGGGPGSLSVGQEVSGLIVSYLNEMGVDTTAFAIASSANPDQMMWLSDADAVKLGMANDGSQPTTIEIKVSNGTPYLRLEQTRREVTGRAVLMCGTKGYLLGVGIVTDHETTTGRAANVSRSYIEIDHRQFGLVAGPRGVQASNDVLWVTRGFSGAEIESLARASDLDVWTENDSAFRWGAQIDISKIHPQIAAFITNCTPAAKQ